MALPHKAQMRLENLWIFNSGSRAVVHRPRDNRRQTIVLGLTALRLQRSWVTTTVDQKVLRGDVSSMGGA